jgi:hypothetical protein
MKTISLNFLAFVVFAGLNLASTFPVENSSSKMLFADDELVNFLNTTAKTYSVGDMNAWIPDNWTISNANGELLAVSPGNTACILLKQIDLNSIDPDGQGILNAGEKFVEEFKSTHQVTILRSTNVPVSFWASKDIPWDWKSLIFISGTTNIRQYDLNNLKFYSIEGNGKLNETERWANVTLIGLPNGKIYMLLSRSELKTEILNPNKLVFNKIIQSLKVK